MKSFRRQGDLCKPIDVDDSTWLIGTFKTSGYFNFSEAPALRSILTWHLPK